MGTILDAANNNNNNNRDDEKPSHYANLKVGVAQEDDTVAFESVGKFGVGLFESRELDAYIANLYEENPDEIQYLDVRIEIRPATPKKRSGTIKMAKRKDVE